jgi:cobalt-zinc-cadmium efflux system membrane fusion protein
LEASVVWADIAVYKQDANEIEPEQLVTIKSSSGETLATGEIAFLLPVFDESSRTATARVIVDNPDGRLHHGQFVTAEIITQDSDAVLRVPSAALQLFEGQKSVFVPVAEGFLPRPVETGNETDGFTEIKSGLVEGEAFVIEGAFTLRAQLEKAAFGSDHDH